MALSIRWARYPATREETTAYVLSLPVITTMDYNLHEAADRLTIEPATLYEWSFRFAPVLSDSVRQALTTYGGMSGRCYTAADIVILRQAQLLLERGLTYDETLRDIMVATMNQDMVGKQAAVLVLSGRDTDSSNQSSTVVYQQPQAKRWARARTSEAPFRAPGRAEVKSTPPFSMWSQLVLATCVTIIVFMLVIFGVGSLFGATKARDGGRMPIRPIATFTQPLPTPAHPLTPALADSPPSSTSTSPRSTNPVMIENQHPGTGQWQLGLRGYQVADDTTGQIKGYASATSVNKRESLTFYVTVTPPQTYTIDIYRMGWYGGTGGRLLQHVEPRPGSIQPACPVDATTGLIACDWAPSYTLTVPATWASGIYLALLTNAQKFQNYVIFVVRDDSRVADLLYQQSVTTYQANNNYPDDSKTGKSLYDYNSYGGDTLTGLKRAVKVSFDRPYTYHGAGEFFKWEVYFVRWLESAGYDVAYATDIDTHANGPRLRNYKGFLSVGHDEYWSKEMYDAVEAARDAGVNLGFFGANAAYWQIRLEPSARGIPNRNMVCYRDGAIDPVAGPTATVKWRDPPANRPEQQLIGIQFAAELKKDLDAYVVTNSEHWVYAGTEFQAGDKAAGVVGPDVDRYQPDYPLPKSLSYTILSRSPVVDATGRSDYANSSIYQAPSGAWVFAAGTIAWSWGLDNYVLIGVGSQSHADPHIMKMTKNILNRFAGRVNS